jgi:hypothetical protein
MRGRIGSTSIVPNFNCTTMPNLTAGGAVLIRLFEAGIDRDPGATAWPLLGL